MKAHFVQRQKNSDRPWLVGRVTPCAPSGRLLASSGAHGVTRPTLWLSVLLLAASIRCSFADTTINPTNRYAFGANVGWSDWLGDTNHGVVIGPQVCSGYIFTPNLGWINVGNGSPTNGVQYQNLSANDFGVNVDGSGNLRGYAFGANIGWVNFETNGAARVDFASGNLSGFAFSPTCGWISLSNAVAYVQTGNKPTIIASPQNLLVTAGQTGTFTVSAGGLPPLSYQWLFNGTNIPGAMLSDFSRTNCQAADAGNYSVLVSNAFGSVTSAVATLVVGFPEIAVEQPAGNNLTDGSASVDFGIVLRGGHSQLTFTIRNTGNGELQGLGISIDGANAADFSVTANPSAPVLAGGSTTFIVTYAPHGSGTNVAALHLNSTDSDESPFDIALVGRVRPPVPSGTIITVAGNGSWNFNGDGGPATAASLNQPNNMAIGPDGTLYIEDGGNYRIRAVNPTNGIITTIAGNGTQGEDGDGGAATNATLDYLYAGLGIDPQRNKLYTAQGDYSTVRQIDLTTGIITRFAGAGMFNPYPAAEGYFGDGGPALGGWFIFTYGLAVGRSNDVFIGDFGHCRMRKVSGATGIITTIAGFHAATAIINCGSTGDGGPASDAWINSGFLLCTDRAGDLFIREGGGHSAGQTGGRVRRIDVNTHIITTVAGGGTNTNYSGPATNMDLSVFGAIAVNDSGELFISVQQQVLKVDLATGMLSVFAGTGAAGDSGDGGAATNAQFLGVIGIAVVPGGGLVIADATAGRIRYVAPGSISLVGDNSQIVFDLPWVSALNGDFTVVGDTNLTTVKAGSLTSVGGDITIVSNAPNLSVDLSSLDRVGTGTNTTTVTLGSGTFTFAPDLTIGTNATLTGDGTIVANVTNAGTISPGSSPGRFDLKGRLVLTGSSRLRLELGGYAPSQIDFLSVTGSVTLGGTLSVSLINNFPSVMTNGASFTLLTAGNPITGAFANTASGGTLTTSDGRARFTVVYAGETSVRLTNLEILNSDSDGDGMSDADELLAGTDPHNAASVFRIVSVQREAGGVRLTWSTVGGKSYRVQTNGSLAGPFSDFSPLITVPGIGESATNFVDVDSAANAVARYYRVRLGP